jgi:hypothetical protein
VYCGVVDLARTSGQRSETRQIRVRHFVISLLPPALRRPFQIRRAWMLARKFAPSAILHPACSPEMSNRRSGCVRLHAGDSLGLNNFWILADPRRSSPSVTPRCSFMVSTKCSHHGIANSGRSVGDGVSPRLWLPAHRVPAYVAGLFARPQQYALIKNAFSGSDRPRQF